MASELLPPPSEDWPVDVHDGPLDLSPDIFNDEARATGHEVRILSEGHAATKEAITKLRHFAMERLTDYDIDGDALDSLELVLAELLQNAYRAAPDDGPREVDLVRLDDPPNMLAWSLQTKFRILHRLVITMCPLTTILRL